MFQIETSYMDELKTKLKELSTLEKPQRDFLATAISEWEQSNDRKNMLTAQAYYANKNESIAEKERWYIDRFGVKRVDENLTNTKLQHPFMRKLTNQKVNHLLSKPLSIQSDDDTFSDNIKHYFEKNFLKLLKNTGKHAIINGLAWWQIYYNEKSELKFKRIPSEEIIPFWADSDRTELDAVLRTYNLIRYSANGDKAKLTKVEFHTKEGSWYYEMTPDGLTEELDRPGKRGHFTVNTINEEGEIIPTQAMWDRIPFVAFKYNSDEISLLDWVKTLIDDYDMITSNFSDSLQDLPNSIKVVKNYDGTDKGEFTQNLATYKTAFVREDGDLNFKTTQMDTTSFQWHVKTLRKDIYDSGSGVDSQEESIGNVSGIALKFRYSDLVNDAQDIANEFRSALDNVIYFIKIDLLNNGIDVMDAEYDIIFNTDMITDESDTIVNAKNSAGIISDETIVANHPWVTDTRAEMERKERETQQKIAEMSAMVEAQTHPNFGEGVIEAEEDEEILTNVDTRTER